MSFVDESTLFQRWAPKGGRYTSYPARRVWNDEPALQAPRAQGEVDAYVHIPFCESLCNFCGLNITVTKDRSVTQDFLKAVLSQAQQDFGAVDSPRLGNLFLGGGTPNYLSASELSQLVQGLLALAPRGPHFHAGMEALPSLFQRDHAKAMQEMGFTRLSLGVQDLNPEVLALAHREQTVRQVAHSIELAHAYSMEAHADMIYGMAGQTPESFRQSVRELLRMGLHAVALYPLIPAPWASGPTPLSFESKVAAYLGARDELLEHGFQNLGQGHFVAPSSKLHSAFRAGTLRRNLSAFFENLSPTTLALGPGAQGYSPELLWANHKLIGSYQSLVFKGSSPIQASHRLTPEEKLKRGRFEMLLAKHRIEGPSPLSPEGLRMALEDGLLVPDNRGLKLTPRGPDHLTALAALLDDLSL